MTARRLLDPQRPVKEKQLEGSFDVALIGWPWEVEKALNQ